MKILKISQEIEIVDEDGKEYIAISFLTDDLREKQICVACPYLRIYPYFSCGLVLKKKLFYKHDMKRFTCSDLKLVETPKGTENRYAVLDKFEYFRTIGFVRKPSEMIPQTSEDLAILSIML